MKFVRSHVLVAQETAKGERPVTFDQISQFNKVRFVAPEDLPMPVYPITTGISPKRRIPTPQSFSWLSPSPRSSSNGPPRPAPYRSDRMSTAAGLKPLSSYRIADGYIDFISNENRTKELRQRFEGYIGPPQGAYISTSPSAPSK